MIFNNLNKSLAICVIISFIRKISADGLFPRARVISLSHHQTRRQHIIKEMKSRKIPFEWMDAIDGKELSQSSLMTNATSLGRWFMTPGMIGCFLSHRQCWEICVRSNEPLLVFEDDVVLAQNFRRVAVAAMEHFTNKDIHSHSDKYEDDWDVVLLGALGCVHPSKTKFGFNWIPSLVGGKWRKMRRVATLALDDKSAGTINIHSSSRSDDHEIITTPTASSLLHAPMCPYGMHAYILSPKGAAKLLKNFPRASYHVDVVAWGLKGLNILAVHPLVAWQTNDDTTIGGLVEIWKRIFPRWVADKYTGFEIGWALTAPLLRVGGHLFGGKLLLTNGSSLAILFVGLVVGIILRSYTICGITFLFAFVVTATVRLLASKWNV